MLMGISKGTIWKAVTLTVILPLAPVVHHVSSCLVLIQIP